MTILDRVWRKTNKTLLHLTTKKILTKPSTHPLEKLGSSYGGWVIPTDILNKDSVCYCVGAGEDISFDLELINRFSCDVYSFDPTPRAATYVQEKAGSNPKYHFFKKGLWSKKETLKFYAPQNASHVSHSVLNLQRTGDYFEAPCDRLSNIMKELNHDHLDLLKMDIEGAEWDVLQTILEDKVPIRILCVEFDKPVTFLKIHSLIQEFQSRGYDLVSFDDWNATFLRK